MGINFCGPTNVKYFMQTELLRFCKDTTNISSLPLLKITTKSTHFLPAKTVDRTSEKIQTVSKPYI